jgi:hypothetical protein
MSIFAEILNPIIHALLPHSAKRIRKSGEPDEAPYDSQSMRSLQKNRHKPCTKCSKPRHISTGGRCNTTLCTDHYKNYHIDRKQKSKKGKT